MRPHKRSLPPKGNATYRRTWRIVRGAVTDALLMHPDYVPAERRKAALESITKRVTGAIVSSFPEQSGRGRP